MIILGIEQRDDGFQRRTARCQRGHRVRTGAVLSFQAAQTVPQDGVSHGQRRRQYQEVRGVEGRRSHRRVQRSDGGQQPRRHKTEVEQHHGQNATEHAAQGQLRAHFMQLVAHLFGRFGDRFLFGSRLCRGVQRFGGRFCGSRSSRFRLGLRSRLGFCCSHLDGGGIVHPDQREAHAVVDAGGRFTGGGGRGVLVVAHAEKAEGFRRLLRLGFGGCRGRGCGLFGPRDVLGEDHLRQRRLGGLFLVLQRLRLHAQHFLRGVLHLHRLFSLGGRRLREEQGLELLHLALLFLLLRGQRAAHIVLFQLGCGGLLRLRGSGRGGLGGRGGSCFRRCRGLCGRFRGKEVCRQFQIRLRLCCLFLAAQPDLPRRRQLLRLSLGFLCRLGSGFLLGPAKEAAQDAGLSGIRIFLVVIAALHLVRHLRHTGAEKGTEFFFLCCKVLRVRILKAVHAFIILRHALSLPANRLRFCPRFTLRRAGSGSHTG